MLKYTWSVTRIPVPQADVGALHGQGQAFFAFAQLLAGLAQAFVGLGQLGGADFQAALKLGPGQVAFKLGVTVVDALQQLGQRAQRAAQCIPGWGGRCPGRQAVQQFLQRFGCGHAHRRCNWRWRSLPVSSGCSRYGVQAAGRSLQQRDGHGLVVQLAVGAVDVGADFAVGIKTGQRGVLAQHLAHGLHFFVHPCAHHQLAAHAADQQGQHCLIGGCLGILAGGFGGLFGGIHQRIDRCVHELQLATLGMSPAMMRLPSASLMPSRVRVMPSACASEPSTDHGNSRPEAGSCAA